MLTSMLEKAIEIEGLLRIIRDGDPLPETYKLLNIKTGQLAEAVNGLTLQKDAPEPAALHTDFVMASPEPAATQQDVVVMDEEDRTPPVELDMEEDDDILLTFEDADEPDETAPISIEVAADPVAVTSTSEASSPMADFPVEIPVSSGFTESEAPEEHAPEEKEAEETTAPKPKRNLRAAFSLNDRFLYSRELFNGNMKLFDSTVDSIADIDDYSLVEDHFYKELNWDAENPNVAGFMEIMKINFK